MGQPFQIHPFLGMWEPVCALTHLVAAGVFCALSASLIQRGRGDAARVAGLAVFALSCVLLLSFSGVYHLLSPGATRAVMQRLDHAAIFALIAGTFTAAHAALFRGAWRWGMIAFIWTLAVAGISLKSVFFEVVPEWLSLGFYLGMGWVGVFSGIKVLHAHGWGVFRPLALGGLAYTIGALLEFLRTPWLVPGVVGPHELFHVLVVIGVSLHWRFILTCAAHRLPLALEQPAPAA